MDDSTLALRIRDFWTAIVLIGVALFFLWQTSLLPFFEADAAGVESGKWYNSAAIIPYFIFATLMLLAIGLLITAIRDGGAKAAINKFPTPTQIFSLPVMKGVAIAAILLAYIFGLVPRVDFVISSTLLITALIYGFHEGRPLSISLSAGTVICAAAYALVLHFPQSEWQTPHDDDWFALGALVALTVAMFVDIRWRYNSIRTYAAATPIIAVMIPFFLVCAMAFGFRQNVPNRNGLIFKQVEYAYYVRLRPWWRSL